MAAEPNRAADPAAAGPSAKSTAAQLRASALDLLVRMRHKPLPSVLVVVGMLVAVFTLGWALHALSPAEGEDAAGPKLADALAQLDAGNWNAARRIAADLRLSEDLPVGQQGGPAYVLGMVMARDAGEHWSPMERRSLYLLASRYLEEAIHSGVPPGRQGSAEFVLGKSLFEYGRYAESLPLLRSALKSYPQETTEIQRLLASAYLQDANPQLDLALQFNREYLGSAALDDQQRDEALLTQAQILLQLGDTAGCRETLTKIADDSRLASAAQLIDGQLLLLEGDQLRGPAGAQQPSAEADEKYSAAIEMFREAQMRDTAKREIVRKSSYLLGVAYRRLGDLPAAENQFSRTRRSHFETPEGLAAGLEEAELQRMLGRHPEAIESYRRVLRQAADMRVYSNPWISLDELRQRAEQAYQDYFEDSDFDRAIELANVFSPMFSADHATQLQARAQQALAEELLREAQQLPAAEAAPLLERAYSAWRNAGAFYAQLGQQRFATREFPAAIWKSANAYLQGHDYRRAERLLKTYLRHETRRNHPPALTALGQAQLALGQTEEALQSLRECIVSFPKDPHSYRARLIAAQAHSELGNLVKAKELLTGNLEHESLTPRSLEWRESLYALGQIHYREGLQYETQSRLDGVNSDEPQIRKAGLKPLEKAHEAFQMAIEKLAEALERDELAGSDPLLPETITARYLMAEAHRQSAKLPLKRLPTVTIETTQNKLNSEIQKDLSAAEQAYLQVQELLNQKQEKTLLSDAERRILRNCYFARADALYDLKRFEEAIQAYSTATNRYQHEPESLEAYVQIANCHRQLNRPSEARGTLEQAKVVLRRIREDADFTETTRYNRDEWAKLLDWLTTL